MTDELDRVMVDIETLGLETGAAIISIGAVRFGPDGLGQTFYRSIDRESCVVVGLEIDQDTLEWWRDQGEVADEVLNGGDELADVLEDFAEWFGTADEVWANSPSFDCEMLEVAYDAVGLVEPWEFYQERDVRTLKALPIAPDFEQDGEEHHALDDAQYQARTVAETLRRLDATEAKA
jgi:DNA polymerase III epsilon subunit-like protein